jgi:hypothetical protein
MVEKSVIIMADLIDPQMTTWKYFPSIQIIWNFQRN